MQSAGAASSLQAAETLSGAGQIILGVMLYIYIFGHEDQAGSLESAVSSRRSHRVDIGGSHAVFQSQIICVVVLMRF